MIYDLQKASMGKRISAFLFDFIIFLVVFSGLALAVGAIVGYDARIEGLIDIYEEYEERFGIELTGDDNGYNSMTDEEKAAYDKRYGEAAAAFDEDERAISLSNELFNYALLIVSLSMLLAFLLMEFTVPLILGNGQTFGKKIFGICLMRDDGVKVSSVIMFVRAILGKYTVETMVPLIMVFLIVFGGSGIIGVAVLLLLFGFNIGLVIKTKTNSFIHDLLAYTVAVDKQSQMIFASKEEMIEYKKRVHAELADKKDY